MSDTPVNDDRRWIDHLEAENRTLHKRLSALRGAVYTLSDRVTDYVREQTALRQRVERLEELVKVLQASRAAACSLCALNNGEGCEGPCGRP